MWCMKTTVNIDDRLLEKVLLLRRHETPSLAVEAALKEYARLHRKEQLLGLSGRLRLEENWRGLREAELKERAGTD